MTQGFRLPPELSISSIARELEAAGLAQMGQGADPDDVIGVFLFRSVLLQVLSEISAGRTIPTDTGVPVSPLLLAPPEILWGFFPGNGEYQPLPAGSATFVLPERIVTHNAEGFTGLQLNVAKTVLDATRSFLIVADSLVKVELDPVSGQFPIAGGVFVGNAREVKRVIVTADRPYNLLLGFSTAELSPQIDSVARFQLRKSTTTLTKVNAAATPDDLAAVIVVPHFGDTALTQATYGDPIITALGWGQKVFRVRNTDAVNAVEVLVQARMSPAGTFEADLEIHPAGARVTIAASDFTVLETGLPVHDIRLTAAVEAAAAAAQTAIIDVEYIGLQPAGR